MVIKEGKRVDWVVELPISSNTSELTRDTNWPETHMRLCQRLD